MPGCEMQMLESTQIICPYCGEPFDTDVDCSEELQDYVEDCPVCCRPIEFHAACAEGQLLELTARRDDE